MADFRIEPLKPSGCRALGARRPFRANNRDLETPLLRNSSIRSQAEDTINSDDADAGARITIWSIERGTMGSKNVPEASSLAVKKRMQNTPRRDTHPELALRSEIHRLGLRYRVDLSPIPGSRRRADVVFKTPKVAVFIDGCFWHSCPIHGSTPKTHSEWWSEKLARNMARDLDTNSTLRQAGWKVVRVWEHEDVKVAASKIAVIVRLRHERKS